MKFAPGNIVEGRRGFSRFVVLIFAINFPHESYECLLLAKRGFPLPIGDISSYGLNSSDWLMNRLQ